MALISGRQIFRLLSAVLLQALLGSFVYRLGEGLTADAILPSIASITYILPLLVAVALVTLGLKELRSWVESPWVTSAAIGLHSCVVAYGFGTLLGIVGQDLLIAAGLVGLFGTGICHRYIRPRMAIYPKLGWIFPISVFLAVPALDVSMTYELLLARTPRLLDPNALLFFALSGLVLLASVSMTPWFSSRRLLPRFATLGVGLALLAIWVAMAVWNRLYLVPRLYPEVHNVIAFFEFFIVLGALSWVVPENDEPPGKKHMAAIVLVCLIPIGVLVGPTHTLAPQHIDYTSHFFSKPFLWVFDDSDHALSTRLGGFDCEPANPSIHPLAKEIRGNGFDENCSGSDALGTSKEEPQGLGNENDVDLTILITIDMLRPDYMSVYGHPRETTPNLEKLATDFVRFDRAYSAGGITTLALPSVTRGRIPMSLDFEHVYRTVDLRYVFPDELQPDDRFNRVFVSPRSDPHPTIASVFQGAGRETYAILDDGIGSIFRKGFGFEKGFQTVYYPNQPEGPGPDQWTSREVTDAALQVVERAEEGAFIWIHYYDPHAATPPCRRFKTTKGLGCYEDAIADIDGYIGDIVAKLMATGRWDTSTMIITSDHGEALGEHGLYHHGLDSYEEFVRIPLLLKSPSSRQMPRQIMTPVSLIDASFTALASAGLTPPSEFQGEDLHRVGQQERRWPVISQQLIMEVDGTPVRQQSLLVEGDSRFMWDRVSGRTWHFDISQDTAQTGPMAPRDLRESKRKKLESILEAMEAKE